jgi:hypothetical protein
MAWDISKGWPYDGSIDDNAKPKDAEGIVSGMAIKYDVNGEMVKADGTQYERAFLAVANQADPDVGYAGKIPFIKRNATIFTDQFINANFSMNQNLEVAAGGNAGKFQEHAAGNAPIVGYYEGKEHRNGIEMIKIALAE